ncbi:histidine kinase [Thauera aromatica]|uniref:hybrid sensor histidine kinase/response regulator n=1 Tax=Thauera aromatica TaxID=59405 RepID=UPI001FFCCD55|nr:ATP-binding protein [Thauera aromatica]MCK2089394.1 histidine kinase [Thauera aromatica]
MGAPPVAAPLPLAALLVEDSESDALLVLRQLRRSGFDVRHARVETAEELRAALHQERWDIVLSDCSLPGFDARTALEVLHSSGQDIPFIVISGTIGDETAIELMRTGAHDYLMKGNLARLGPAVQREIGEARMRAERRRTLAALRDSEASLREAQRIAGLGQWRIDPPGERLWCSDTLYALFGLERIDEQHARHALLTRIHPGDLAAMRQAHRELQAGTERFDIEYRILHTDGNLRHVRECAARATAEDGTGTRLIGTLYDITAQKAASEALQAANARLRRLSGRILDAQEAERREVARELHDQIGQALTAVKLELQGMAPSVGDGPAAHRLASAIHITEEALAQVRGLSLNLRPPQLDYMGLEASLRWHAERQCERAGLTLAFRSSLGPTRLDTRIEIVCFRLVQEAVTNIVRHAAASRVDIEVGLSGPHLEVSVRDDGHGFDVDRARRRMLEGRSAGLLGMEERAALIGGEVAIESATGCGTRVRVVLPATDERTQG